MQTYVVAVKWLAAKVAPTGARYILDPCGFRRAVVASFAAFLIALTPLIVPAQMTSQEREEMRRQGEEIRQVRSQIERTAGKVEALEDRTGKIEATVTDVVRSHNALDKAFVESVAAIRSDIDNAKMWLGIAWVIGGLLFAIGKWYGRISTTETGEKPIVK